MINLGGMSTETRNERTMNLDAMPVDELLRVMNDEDARVAEAIRQALPQIDPGWRLALVTGFLGALTTFSSCSAEVVTMLQQQRYLLAAGTTGLHLGGSLLMTLLGLQTVALALASRP